jgi:N6-adenosine-specific RNA methylase IME4
MSAPKPDKKVLQALECIANTPVSVLQQAKTELLESARSQVSLAAHVDPIPKTLAKFKPLPPGPFALMVIRPRWSRRGVALSKTSAKRTLTIHDLVQLDPVSSMAPDAVLAICAPAHRIPDAYLFGDIWGLSFVGVMFVEVSLDSKTHVPILKSGVFTKSNADFLLMFTRGNPSFTVADKTHSQIIFSHVDEEGQEVPATAADVGNVLTPSVPTRKGPRKQYRSATGILFHPGATNKPCHPIADDFMDAIFRNIPKCQVFTDELRDGWFGYGKEAETGEEDLVTLMRQAKESEKKYNEMRKSRRSKSKRKRLGHTAINDEDSVPSIIRYRTTPGPKPKRPKPLTG